MCVLLGTYYLSVYYFLYTILNTHDVLTKNYYTIMFFVIVCVIVFTYIDILMFNDVLNGPMFTKLLIERLLLYNILGL